MKQDNKKEKKKRNNKFNEIFIKEEYLMTKKSFFKMNNPNVKIVKFFDFNKIIK